MTKKKLAIIEIVLYIGTFIFLYFEHMYHWYIDFQFNNKFSFIYLLTDRANYYPVYYIGWALIGLIIGNVIFLVIYCFKHFSFQDKKGWIALSLLPAATYLLFSIYAIVCDNQWYYGNHFAVRFGPVFYLEITLLLLALGVSCYRQFSNIPYVIFVEASEINYFEPVVHSADELIKYKELLDDGIISQEEFDAKKKQLLGL